MERTTPKLWAYLATVGIAIGATAANSDDRPMSSNIITTAELSPAELEERFWVCDYVATARGMHATPTDLCGVIYTQLKATKFGDDFGLLLAWWTENKAAEHRKLVRRGL